MLILQLERVFATLLQFICNFMDFEQCLCKMLKTKTEDTRSATTNFGKEEVSKIRQGIQVFARNTRSSYIVVFPLGQRRVSQELNQNRNCHIYIYIYIYGGFYFVSLHQKQQDNHRTNFGFWCLLTFLTIFIVFGQKCSNFLPLRATQDSK